MKRRRRCEVCHELFDPEPRSSGRQRTCRRPECQKERHRENCRTWREREAPDVEEDRLRRRLGGHEGELRLDVVRDECGSKVKVIIEEALRLAGRRSRDSLAAKEKEKCRKGLGLAEVLPRDACALKRRVQRQEGLGLAEGLPRDSSDPEEPSA
jgi:hypothetical protein